MRGKSVFNLYKNRKVSTGRAAEIANLTVAEFVHECQKRRVPLSIGIESIDELEDEMNLLREQRKRS